MEVLGKNELYDSECGLSREGFEKVSLMFFDLAHASSIKELTSKGYELTELTPAGVRYGVRLRLSNQSEDIVVQCVTYD